MVAVAYGDGDLITIGNYESEALEADCIEFDEDERITNLAVRSGYWPDEFVFSTHKRPEPMRVGGWEGTVRDVTVAPPKGGRVRGGL